MKYYDTLYLDLEKDVVIDFYIENDKYFYILKTPNHKTGNLIRNFAYICKLPLTLDSDNLLQIEGDIIIL